MPPVHGRYVLWGEKRSRLREAIKALMHSEFGLVECGPDDQLPIDIAIAVVEPGSLRAAEAYFKRLRIESRTPTLALVGPDAESPGSAVAQCRTGPLDAHAFVQTVRMLINTLA